MSNIDTIANGVTEFENRLASCTSRGNLQPSTPEREADIASRTDASDMVGQVNRRIGTIEARMAESRGFTKAGAVNYVIGVDDPRRQGMANELYHLRTAVLPYTQAKASEIRATQSRTPSAEQTLQAEASRRDRLQAEAVKRAEAIEVEEIARRMVAARQRQS